MLISTSIDKGVGFKSCPGKVNGNLKVKAAAEVMNPILPTEKSQESNY